MAGHRREQVLATVAGGDDDGRAGWTWPDPSRSRSGHYLGAADLRHAAIVSSGVAG